MRILIVEAPGNYPRAYGRSLAAALRALGHRILVRPWTGGPDRREAARLAAQLLELTRPEVVHVVTSEPWIAESFTGRDLPVVHSAEDRPSRADWIVAPSEVALRRILGADPSIDRRALALPYALETDPGERGYGSVVRLALDPRDGAAAEWMAGAARELPYLPLSSDADLRDARMVVSISSRPEAWPPGIAEAMAAGRPVLATWSGAAAELVVEGVTGFLSAPGDLRSLRTHLEYLWDHPEESLRLGAEALKEARQVFSPERHARELLRLYLRAGASRLAV